MGVVYCFAMTARALGEFQEHSSAAVVSYPAPSNAKSGYETSAAVVVAILAVYELTLLY